MDIKKGSIVHFDVDDEEWGRVASDGEVMTVLDEKELLVNAFSIRANIIVPTKLCRLKEAV